MYVADGVTNASLPKGMTPDELTREQALELLAARAALGPPVKKGRAAKGTKKAAAPKKAAKKASAKKKKAEAE